MKKLDKKSQKEFFDGLEILMIRLAKRNPDIEQRFLFAEVMEIFLHIIFGFFQKNHAETQFVPSVMASISNYIADNAYYLSKEKNNE